MAGIYIHVPFCSKRCTYCDFFSNTDMRYKETYITSAIRELELRKDYLNNELIETIYFGGGTPSQLNKQAFDRFFEAISSLFTVDKNAEITLEANPDDMTPEYIRDIRTLPFNRVSMGVQSFKNADLLFLNRRHDSKQALQAINLCKENGLTNLSIDLIYGLPGQSMDDWQANLDEAIRLDIPHLSAYHLIYEEGTPLFKQLKAGKVHTVEEELSADMFSTMIDRLAEAGYEQYEISNFAKNGLYSRHNSSYWTGAIYLGIGPSAHSYNGNTRQWNISSLPKYFKGIENGTPDVEIEQLDAKTRYNDFIITGLRTMWGINLDKLRDTFGEKMLAYCMQQAAP
ncbi:MAG: radical SAM family heme chaperone HemW, partial [Parabacteroides sp.]|nr:radical SAM family heme chaperone HemW [Parabacteroides sp.]